MEKVKKKIYCSRCKSETNHGFLTNKNGVKLEYKLTHLDFMDLDFQFNDDYYIVQCLGCDNIAFLNIYGDESMYEITYYDEDNYSREYYEDYNVYPEKPKEKLSAHLQYNSPFKFNNLPDSINELREEVVQAYKEDMRLLCGMGIRMLVEAICKEKGITETQVIKNNKPKFDDNNNPVMRNLNLYEKIEILKDKNIIDESQKEVLHQVREMGNDTAHEIKSHSNLILKQALHIVELILYNIYEVPNIKILPNKSTK